MFDTLSSIFPHVSRYIIAPYLLAASLTAPALADSSTNSALQTPKKVDITKPILAHEDPAILAACPQINDITIISTPNKAPKLKAYGIHLQGGIYPEYMHPVQWQVISSSLFSAQTLNPQDNVAVFIKSAGGGFYAGKMIYDYLKSSPAKIFTIAAEEASSIASLILFSGDRRRIVENTNIVLHAVHQRNLATNEISYLEDLSDVNNRQRISGNNTWFKQQYLDLSTTGSPRECIDQLIGSRDIRITGVTALKLGFVDEVITPDNDLLLRNNDPHAIAYRQKIAAGYSEQGLETMATLQSDTIKPLPPSP